MVWPSSQDDKLTEHNIVELPGQNLASSEASCPLDNILNLDYKSASSCIRLTSVGATYGPSCKDIGTIERMIEAGMNLIRIPLSYTNNEDIEHALMIIRQAIKNYSAKVGRLYPLAIAFEIKGRSIHTGMIADCYGGVIELTSGDILRLTTDESYREKGTKFTVFVDFDKIADTLARGDIIYIDNETITLKVEIVASSAITCKIERGGQLGSFKEVYIPEAKIKSPNITDQDLIDIEFAINSQVDFIIVPYVNGAEMVKEFKKILSDKGKKINIVAKIQTKEALDKLDEIFDVSSYIILARQELGTEISLKKLPMVQKNVISRATKANVACAVSSQMLHTMIKNQNPLRAEVMDVANSVMDGADLLLLEAETSHGAYPVEAIRYQASICKEAEACMWTKQSFMDSVTHTKLPCDSVTATAMAACLAASRCMAAAVLVITTSGRAAELVSRFRPRCPIIAITRYPQIARQLQYWRGVVPSVYEETPHADWLVDVERRVNFGTKFGLEKRFVRLGDPIVIVSGWKQGAGFTNTLRIIYAAEEHTVLM